MKTHIILFNNRCSQVFCEVSDERAALVIFAGKPAQHAVFMQVCEEEGLAVSMHVWNKCKSTYVRIDFGLIIAPAKSIPMPLSNL